MKHEHDCVMVETAYKNRGQSEFTANLYVPGPDNNVEGTNLFTHGCDGETEIASKADLAQGFNPAQPVLLVMSGNDGFCGETVNSMNLQKKSIRVNIFGQVKMEVNATTVTTVTQMTMMMHHVILIGVTDISDII